MAVLGHAIVCKTPAPGPSPCLALPQPQPCSCCQQPLTPGTFPEAFPGSFPRLVPRKLLWQSRIWVCCSPGCGECPPSLMSGQFSLFAQSRLGPTPVSPSRFSTPPEAPSAGPEAPSAGPEAPSAGPEAPSAGPEAPSAGPEAPSAGPEAPSAGPEALAGRRERGRAQVRSRGRGP
ncbi:postacrosomal sheath WW domain-binding protein-like [Anomalospiza imberbis]|uniref:postacrosomal sheath WW domain-binding protein-like n=1 Tax=Anomalospiza imberbis TaxID=187417 RepID=UPI00358E3D02